MFRRIFVALLFTACGSYTPVAGDECLKIGAVECANGATLQCEKPGTTKVATWRQLGTCSDGD